MTSQPAPPLRIGVLLDSLMIKAWTYEMLETLHNSDYANIELLIVNTTPNPPPPALAGNAVSKLSQRVAIKAAKLIEHKFLDRNPAIPAADTRHDITQLLPDAEVLEVAAIKKQFSDYLNEEDLAAIKKSNLDIILRIGFRIVRGDLLKAATHGIWSFHHGDNRVNRGGPPCFWETMESWPEVGSVLQILEEELDNGRVLYRSYSGVDKLSLKDTKNRLYWKTQAFIPRVMEQLHQQGDDFYQRIDAQQEDARFYSNRLYRDAGPYHHLGLVLRKSWQKVMAIVHNKRHVDQWALMYDFAPKSDEDALCTSPWRYKKLLPPKDRFWADPHVISRQGKHYIYIEELPYSTGKGHISVITMDDNGEWEDPVTVIEKPYHLSYPFVFEADNELWMIPESGANSTVELYKCTGFPHQWELQMNLLSDTTLVDATLHFKDGYWWMFGNMSPHRYARKWDELHLFYSKDFRSTEWTPHPLNPIVSDVKSARPAGRLLERNGKLLRPSQNCSVRYGYGFNFSEISTLTPTDYQETVVDRITPDWDPSIIATHTFSKSGRLSVIDAMMVRRR